MDKKLSAFAKASADKRQPAGRPGRQRYYTLMLVPHDASGPALSLKIPAWLAYSVLGAAAFSVIFVGSTFVYSAMLTRKLANYHFTIARNVEQREMIASFSNETAKVNEALTELRTQDNQLRQLLGLKSWKSKIKLANNLDLKEHPVKTELAAAGQEITDRQKSLKEMKAWVNQVRQRFANTPSRWPVSGRIVSRFGFRVYPWRGFHSGLDISGSYGAPIRATADGTVTLADWQRGYGRTVIVNHGFGKETLYGHCSKFAVKAGQQIKKGQVIAYIGTTGYSTGPHLHYEVKNRGRAVNPVAYLNLKLLSASKIWRD